MPATVVNVSKAKAQLSELLERALNGEEIIFAKRGQPLAKLTPLRPTRLLENPNSRVFAWRITPREFETKSEGGSSLHQAMLPPTG